MECRIAIDDFLQDINEIEQNQAGCPVHLMAETVKSGIKYSCGKTVFCRDGLLQLAQIISDIAGGKGRTDDLMLLDDICHMLETESQCSLVEIITDKIMKSISDNRDEWEKHCNRKLCSQMVCKGCYNLYIDPAVCNGCGECKRNVSAESILGSAGMIHIIKNDMELKGQNIEAICPLGAIKKMGPIKPQVPDAPVPVGSFKPAGGLLKKRRRTT